MNPASLAVHNTLSCNSRLTTTTELEGAFESSACRLQESQPLLPPNPLELWWLQRLMAQCFGFWPTRPTLFLQNDLHAPSNFDLR